VGIAGAEAAPAGARPRVDQPAAQAAPAASPPSAGSDVDSLIRGAAADLSEYQRLTAEGKLGDAGARLDALKQKLEQLAHQRR
jgi:hypothetical protein